MTTPHIYKAEAIVLRQRKLGEAGKIVTLYTPNYGKLDAVARGVRRPKSRLGGHLEVLTHTMVMLAQGRNLDVVTQAQTIESFAPLRADLHRLSRALYAAELVDRISPEGGESYQVFQLLLATLRRLAAVKNVDTVLRYLEMQLLNLSGFQPQLDRCVDCQQPLAPAPSYFSPAGGGVLCPTCGRDAGGARPLSLNALKVMRLLQSASFGEISRVRISLGLAQEIEMHLRAYLVYVLERDVRSAAFIDRLRREGSWEPAEIVS
ncbi:MAG: DNA repair protein RecO [Dehalococcoidia bacterium]